MTKNLIIDSNIIRRLFENNYKVSIILDYLYKKGYLFSISDHSLFELFDYLDSSVDKIIEYDKLIFYFNKYDIELMHRKTSKELYDNYHIFLQKKYSIKQIKSILYKSFEFSMINFLKDIYRICILCIANSITDKYDSPFYMYIVNLFKTDKFELDVEKHLKEVLKNSYLYNKFKCEKYIKKDFRDLIIRVLCYHELYETSFNKIKFNETYNNYSSKYNDLGFSKILEKYYKKDKIIIKNLDNIDELQFIFSKKYLEDLMKGRKFSINDLVDYLNFEKAFKNNSLYYTLDDKSLRIYQLYFENNQEILNYIDLIKRMKDIPYNVLNLKEIIL